MSAEASTEMAYESVILKLETIKAVVFVNAI